MTVQLLATKEKFTFNQLKDKVSKFAGALDNLGSKKEIGL